MNFMSGGTVASSLLSIFSSAKAGNVNRDAGKVVICR